MIVIELANQKIAACKAAVELPWSRKYSVVVQWVVLEPQSRQLVKSTDFKCLSRVTLPVSAIHADHHTAEHFPERVGLREQVVTCIICDINGPHR